jgi:hypothetical protein
LWQQQYPTASQDGVGGRGSRLQAIAHANGSAITATYTLDPRSGLAFASGQWHKRDYDFAWAAGRVTYNCYLFKETNLGHQCRFQHQNNKERPWRRR